LQLPWRERKGRREMDVRMEGGMRMEYGVVVVVLCGGVGLMTMGKL
jgi:hypothetical protein